MELKLSALIVDDEESARKLLFKLLEETAYFSDIKLSRSVESARQMLDVFRPDLIFLDIKMPGKHGLDFVNEIKIENGRPGIVFVTAYEQYAIPAIRVQAFDYLLKPVNRKELKDCVENFMIRLMDNNVQQLKGHDIQKRLSRLKVNTRTGTVFVNPATILYCRAEGNYSAICTGGKEFLCTLNLGKIKEQLPEGFIRVGRSLILNFEYITMLDRKKSTVTLSRDKETVVVKIPHQHLKDLDII